MVIKQYNISPETLRHPSQMREDLIDELVACKPDIPELLEAKRLGYAMTANGAMFDKSRLGWFPKIIQKFFDKRVAYKKEMKKWQKELERLLQQPVKDNAAINHAISQIAVYDARQMAVKIAINSLYGALGNEGFRYYNHSMAEGITTSGQLASRYIERKVVELLNKMLGKDKPAEEWVVAGDTDSVVGETEIIVNGKRITIADFYQRYSSQSVERRPSDFVAAVSDGSQARAFDNGVVDADIKWVMKHRVKKEMFKIIVGDKEVIVTEDHSVMVSRDGRLIECKPRDILPTDKILVLKD
nr:MAG TPA: DNA polymerase [Caudoviricetes sp.]